METDASIRTHALPVETGTPTALGTYLVADHGRIPWAAILAGAAVAIAMWIALQLFGFAIGLLVVHVDDGGSARGAAIGAGVWGAVCPIIAFLLGGIVVGHAGHAMSRASQIVNASVMWAVGAIAGIAVLAMMMMALVRGTAAAGERIAGGAAKLAGTAASGLGDAAHASGLHASDALAPVNQRLRAEGKPAVTAAQLEAATKDVVADAVASGTLDRDAVTRSIASETALSDTDARDVANRVEVQFDQAKQALATELAIAKEKAMHAAQRAAEVTGEMMAGLFVALVLAMLATIGGVMLGGRYRGVSRA